MKKLIILLAIVALAVAIFLVVKTNTNQEALPNPTLKFSSGECNESISPYNSSNLGIKEKNWRGSDILEIRAFVSINCVEEITGGNFTLTGNNLLLSYTSPECTICTTCLCAHEVVYDISDLPKKEYNITLNRI